MNNFEQKFANKHFVRVDADVVDKLIVKEKETESTNFPWKKKMN